MNLAFSEKINNKPSFFIEKIWFGLKLKFIHQEEHQLEYLQRHISMFKITWNMCYSCKSKIHTIRKDPKVRWKVGNKIHFIINNRTKNRFQFAPVLEVKAVQKIEIVYGKTLEDGIIVDAYVDGKLLYYAEELQELAQNDGFDTIDDFFAYFSEDFTGIIIHWTDKIY